MGVRGLTTYVNFNQDVFLKQHQLHNSNIVIDGNSLCAQLYRRLNCFSAFGGDYDKFANYIKNFFKSFKKCHINSYVIFDGSYESRKLKTAFSRLRSKINGASRLDPVSQTNLQIFPLLLRDVFKQVLAELSVAYTVCEFEADDEIAALARHLNCPVLSYDSDFFIYNVLYIPFNTLDYKPKVIERDNKKIHVLECKLFKIEYLIKNLQINPEMLPLLATLLGNDYVQKRVFSKFFHHLKLPKGKKKRNEQQRSIQGLINWLQHETLDSAITKIVGRLKKKDKDIVFDVMKKSIDGYNCKHSKSLKYFQLEECAVDTTSFQVKCTIVDDAEDVIESGDETEKDTENDSSSDEDSGDEEVSDMTDLHDSLPDWVSEYVRKNIIPHTYINLYTLHLHFCCPQAEDYSKEDAFLCTLPILRYAFDILTDFSQEHCVYVSRENDSNFKRIFVDVEYAIPQPVKEKYSEMPLSDTKTFLIHFLRHYFPNLDHTVVETVPANFQMIVFSILWWIKHCNVSSGNLHSIIISYIMLEVIDEKIGTFRGAHFFNNKYSSKLEELNKKQSVADYDFNLNKNKVTYEDCLLAASSLLQYFELSNEIRKRPKSYDCSKMHCFAQFQCCLQQFNCLNMLCNSPYECTNYAKFFNGTFVYNIACKLDNQAEPEKFFEQYLKGATTVLIFYKSLANVVKKCIEQLGISLVNSYAGKKKRRGKKSKKDINSDLSFLIEGFASEVVI